MITALKKAIYSKLNGSSAVTATLSSATAIYHIVAPAGAVLPYIIYTPAGGGSDNDTPLDSADVMYYIKGVADTASSAEAVAEAVYNTMHEASLSIDSPWTVYRCQHNQNLTLYEATDKAKFWHVGASYRIRISQ